MSVVGQVGAVDGGEPRVDGARRGQHAERGGAAVVQAVGLFVALLGHVGVQTPTLGVPAHPATSAMASGGTARTEWMAAPMRVLLSGRRCLHPVDPSRRRAVPEAQLGPCRAGASNPPSR